MLQLAPQTRVFLALEPADFRRGIDGLAALCRQRLGEDPMGGAIFVFRNRQGTALKLLCYDGAGVLAVPETPITGAVDLVAVNAPRQPSALGARAADPPMERQPRGGSDGRGLAAGGLEGEAARPIAGFGGSSRVARP